MYVCMLHNTKAKKKKKEKKKKKKKKASWTVLPRLELGTSRLTAGRASQLRHKTLDLVTADAKMIHINGLCTYVL